MVTCAHTRITCTCSFPNCLSDRYLQRDSSSEGNPAGSWDSWPRLSATARASKEKETRQGETWERSRAYNKKGRSKEHLPALKYHISASHGSHRTVMDINATTHARKQTWTTHTDHTHTHTRSPMGKDAARNKRENKGTATEWGFNNVCLCHRGGAGSEHHVVSKNTELGQTGIQTTVESYTLILRQRGGDGRRKESRGWVGGDERAREVKWVGVRERTDEKRARWGNKDEKRG